MCGVTYDSSGSLPIPQPSHVLTAWVLWKRASLLGWVGLAHGRVQGFHLWPVPWALFWTPGSDDWHWGLLVNTVLLLRLTVDSPFLH